MSKTQMRLNLKNSIQSLRSERNLTQEELAHSIGVTRATVISIEKEKYNPSLELAFRLAIFFEKELTDIFKVEGEYEHANN